ncbi:cyclase family protein [Patescibacteria group bacterium]
MKKIYDLTLPISTQMMRYPNTPLVKFHQFRGRTSVSHLVHVSTHTGTHVDAQSHVRTGGQNIENIPLEKLVGPCRVLDVRGANEAIRIADIEKYHIKRGERILFRTKNSGRGFVKFKPKYIYLDGDAADYLAKIGIALVGIDALSIKKRGSDDTRPHDSLLFKKIVILEGLNLSQVPAGKYELTALPLPLKGLDGSPARVILKK